MLQQICPAISALSWNKKIGDFLSVDWRMCFHKTINS